MTDLPFDGYPGRGREFLRRLPGGISRKGYGEDVLRYCNYRCAYCELDMSTFEGWLQLSTDHVIPQQMIASGHNADWVLDEANVVACCRTCNDLFNRDPVIGEVPLTESAFFDLRDAVFQRRRRRILERREIEQQWFNVNVAASLPEPRASDSGPEGS